MEMWEKDPYSMADRIPETYGEAIQRWPFIECLSHEWDNRTSCENAEWIIEQLELRCGHFQLLHIFGLRVDELS